MMSKKIKILSGVILVEVLLIVVSIFIPKGNATFSTDNSDFSIPNSELVKYITINGNKITKLDQFNWVTTKGHPVDDKEARDLAKGMERITLKQPVPKEELSEVNTLLDKGNDVIFLDAGAKELKHFKISHFHERPIARMEGASTPYYIQIPGKKDDFYQKFDFMNRKIWIDKTILSANSQTLQNIQVEYPEFSQNNFKVGFKENALVFEGINKLDSIKLYNYLVGFSRKLKTKEFIDNTVLKDSLSKTTPDCVITLSSTVEENSNQLLLFFPKGTKQCYGISAQHEKLCLFDWNYIKQYTVRKKHFEKFTP